MVSAQQIQATMARYVELVGAGDINGIIALYGQDAMVEDWICPYKTGHQLPVNLMPLPSA
ncbi:hypothetical protein [Pseudomonas sp. HLT2-19-2]